MAQNVSKIAFLCIFKECHINISTFHQCSDECLFIFFVTLAYRCYMPLGVRLFTEESVRFLKIHELLSAPRQDDCRLFYVQPPQMDLSALPSWFKASLTSEGQGFIKHTANLIYCVCVCVCVLVCVKLREQFAEVSSSVWPHRSQGSNSGHQTWPPALSANEWWC